MLFSKCTTEKLNDYNIIKKEVALISSEKVGLTLTAFIEILLDRPDHENNFIENMLESSMVQECHHVAGDYSYVIKVRCRNTNDLENFLKNTIKSIDGVQRTRTNIVLSTKKETTELPILEPAIKKAV